MNLKNFRIQNINNYRKYKMHTGCDFYVTFRQKERVMKNILVF